MLAVPAQPFDSPDYLFEPKWDGVRCIAFVDRRRTTPAHGAGRVRLQSRNAKDITRLYPELAEAPRAFHVTEAILDGEIVVGGGKRGTFHHLAARNSLKDEARVATAARSTPATLVVFDILLLDGTDLTGRPLVERKEALAHAFSPRGATPAAIAPFFRGRGLDLYREAVRLDLEGIMAKRSDGRYLPGRRSRLWLKIKAARTMSCVICGFWPRTNARGSVVGVRSLILGAYRGAALTYLGRVGTGLAEAESAELAGSLADIVVPSPPFGRWPPDCDPSTLWVRPAVVCEVSYTEVTPTWRLRHPSFLGVRHDLPPEACTLPTPAGEPDGG